MTEEPTETLYLIGAEARIVGISGFTVRPPRARREKPKVSAFTSAKIDAIVKLKPDLVIGFSDIQADIAGDLIKAGIEVWISNHRSVAGIIDYIRRLGALVGASEKAEVLALRAEQHIAEVQEAAALIAQSALRANPLWRRPRVYFEEWDVPMISSIRWVAELIRIAGGDDIFADLAEHSLARDRIISDSNEVIRRAPDIIIGSWCGKRFRADKVAARSGWDQISAVREGRVFEIKSPLILQPGPAALFDGLDALHRLIAAAN